MKSASSTNCSPDLRAPAPTSSSPTSLRTISADMPDRRLSGAAFAHAQRFIPGGVNSLVRAFRAVGGTPVFVASAAGRTLVDLDGNTYLDYVMSWGPLILGHAHADVVTAIRDAAALGTSYGAPTEAETE